MSKTATLKEARAAKAKAAELVKGHPAVNGVGITRDGDGYAVKLNLSSRPKADPLPKQIDGVPVRIETVGPIRKRRSSRKSA
jgi:hypothetical protein